MFSFVKLLWLNQTKTKPEPVRSVNLILNNLWIKKKVLAGNYAPPNLQS